MAAARARVLPAAIRRLGVLPAAALLGAQALLPSAVAAQAGELRGRVLAADGIPLARATVTLTGIGFSVRTDSAGAFRLTGTAGSTIHLTVTADGFRGDTASVQLLRGKAVARDFVLLAADARPTPERSGPEDVLRGRVTDDAGVPVSWANVQVNGGRRILSDQEGRFTVPLPAGDPFTLLVRRIGFEPQLLRLESRPDTVLLVRMSALATLLPEQHVAGRAAFASLDLRGFYRRMRDAERGINHGYFVTPEELELRNPGAVTDAVEAVPTVRIRPIPGSPFPLSRNMRIEDRNGCPMTVFLDGVRLQPFVSVSERKLLDTGINELVHPQAVAGIEVYPRAIGAPPEFQANNGTCGVVLIWSK